MSGPITHNKSITRRQFIKHATISGCGIAAALGAVGLKEWFKKSNLIQITSHDLNSLGHQVREQLSEKSTNTSESIDVAIIGAGISGLSAGYFLEKSGFQNFKIFEMNSVAGGNAEYFNSKHGKASWGAHYLPIIRNDDSLLKDFLKEHNIITGESNGLPNYNEEYLCHDPHERLFIRGRWQDSLIPQTALEPEALKEIQEFLKFTDSLKSQKGSDGKFLFSIPVDDSSADPDFRKLDQMSFKAYLLQKNWKSEALHWYTNYACLDDFGTTSEATSAWAGLHYFCARNGKAANTEEQSVLTWPEGNGFLSDCLQKNIKKKIYANSLVRKISKKDNFFEIQISNTKENTYQKFEAKKVIYCLPRYTAPFVIDNYPKTESLKYYPWIISHMYLEKAALEKNHALAWDTVRFLSSDLGYINNYHQYITQNTNEVLITFYSVFADGTPRENRKLLSSWNSEEIKKDLLTKLEKYHPGIESAIQSIDYRILGHAMISPAVNFIWNERKNVLPSEWNGIHFAHSDMSGISIFEEAFHRGHQAFLKVKNAAIS